MFATANSTWTTLLIDGGPSAGNAINAEVHGWHEVMKKFKPDMIQTRLYSMRAYGYGPTGEGGRTPVEKTAERKAINE